MKQYEITPNWPLTLAAIVCLGLFLFALLGCASFRNIPAESTPQREARYYRTQDVANVAAGAGMDLLLRSVCHGPTQQIAVAMDSLGQYHPYKRWFTGSQCPVLRVGLVGGLGLARRQWDKGYRESGLFMNLYGATATEILHLLVDAITKHWGPVQGRYHVTGQSFSP